MSEDAPENPDQQRVELAAAFDAQIDPLSEHAETFERLEVDPIEMFLREGLARQNPADKTRTAYERLFRDWRGHMAREGRHPACPGQHHVESYVEYLESVRENKAVTIETKLGRLNKLYAFWQHDPAFPHSLEYNPFLAVVSKLDLSHTPPKRPPRIPIDELGAIVRSVKDIRDRAIIATQLKLGLRASEVANIRLSELHVDHPDLDRAYPELASHDRLSGRSNVVYIPSRYEREYNKSHCARLLPIDDELRDVFVHYLLTRPDTGTKSVFLTELTHNQLDQEDINRCWKRAFRPEYDETEEFQAVTSHYGRHRFTTYWRVEQEINRELVKYMRGDTIEGDRPNGDVVDTYIHTYYEDVEEIYRERMYELEI